MTDRAARKAGAGPKAGAASETPTSPRPSAAADASPAPTSPAPPTAPAAPRRVTAEPATSRNGPFVLASYHSGNAAQAEIDQRDGEHRMLATAVFVAGNARLQPGHRYSLALRPGRLLVLGPTDVDPAAVVLDRAVAEIEVRSLDGRLVLSEPHSRSGLVLAFMSVAGASTEGLVSIIADAARKAGAD